MKKWLTVITTPLVPSPPPPPSHFFPQSKPKESAPTSSIKKSSAVAQAFGDDSDEVGTTWNRVSLCLMQYATWQNQGVVCCLRIVFVQVVVHIHFCNCIQSIACFKHLPCPESFGHLQLRVYLILPDNALLLCVLWMLMYVAHIA